MENKIKAVGENMNKIINIIVLLFIPCLSFAQTHIPPGDVSGTWTIEGSPYIIDGHITVPVDSTLIIEPSVFVIFSTNNGLQIEGRLISEGTENDSIIFTVQDTSSNTGVGFYHTDITNQDSSKITYSIFEHVSVCFDKSSNILFRKSSVSNCVGWSGVFFDENSSPTLIDITISDNTTEYYGGGIYCTDSSNPSLVNVTISGNTATWGGGISCRYNSNPTLENVNIINNSAVCIGGGILCEESSPIINNVFIDGNEGSGIRCIDGSSPTLNNVTISNNKMGIDSRMSNPIITNTIITGNRPIGGFRSIGGDIILRNVIISDNENTDPSVICFGGGMHINGNVSIVNALIINNYISTVNVGGGGIFNVTGNLSLTNVVVTGNYAEPGCGGMWCQYGSNTSVTNSIFWDNNDSWGGNIEIVVLGGGWEDEITISYTNIEEGQNGVSCGGTLNWGEGNIDLDPLFTDSLYHLSEDSPCIDAGNPDSLYYDIEGPYNPGYALYPAMGTIRNDMGAYGGHGYYEPPCGVADEQIPNHNSIQLTNYPNPFTSYTTISYQLPPAVKESVVEIYNIKGELVKSYQCLNSGSIIWDGTNQCHKKVNSGIYLYRIKYDNHISKIKRMILVR